MDDQGRSWSGELERLEHVTKGQEMRKSEINTELRVSEFHEKETFQEGEIQQKTASREARSKRTKET